MHYNSAQNKGKMHCGSEFNVFLRKTLGKMLCGETLGKP